MNPHCHGRRNYEGNVSKNASLIEDYITQLDQTMSNVNSNILGQKPVKDTDISFLSQAGIVTKFQIKRNKALFVPFRLNSNDYKDLGVLCATYSYDAVKECIGYVYENYNSQFKVTCIGALVRTILKENISRQQVSSLFEIA